MLQLVAATELDQPTAQREVIRRELRSLDRLEGSAALPAREDGGRQVV